MVPAPSIACELFLISLPLPQQFRGSHDAVEFLEIIHPVAERRIGSMLLEARVVVTCGAGQRTDNAARKYHDTKSDLCEFIGGQERRIAAFDHVGEQRHGVAKLLRNTLKFSARARRFDE